MAWKYDVHAMPCPGDAGAPFENTPMVMMGLHPTGEVGLAGPLPQPDNIAAKVRHTTIRINMMKTNLSDGRRLNEWVAALDDFRNWH